MSTHVKSYPEDSRLSGVMRSMSSYFDSKANELIGMLEKVGTDPEAHDLNLFNELRRIDTEVVFDCTCCVESDGCPDDIRDAVAKCVYEYSVECQPANRSSKFQPAYETMAEHVKGMLDMVGKLHDIFHDLASMDIDGFSDHPLTPIRRLATRGDERRELMVPREEFSDFWVAAQREAGHEV